MMLCALWGLRDSTDHYDGRHRLLGIIGAKAGRSMIRDERGMFAQLKANRVGPEQKKASNNEKHAPSDQMRIARVRADKPGLTERHHGDHEHQHIVHHENHNIEQQIPIVREGFRSLVARTSGCRRLEFRRNTVARSC